MISAESEPVAYEPSSGTLKTGIVSGFAAAWGAEGLARAEEDDEAEALPGALKVLPTTNPSPSPRRRATITLGFIWCSLCCLAGSQRMTPRKGRGT